MSLSRESPASDPDGTFLPFGFDVREIRLTSVGWTLFIVCQVAYCTAYTHMFAAAPWELRETLAWAVKHWGIWLILTPLVFRVARRHEAWLVGGFLRYAALASGALAVSLPVRVTIEMLLSGQATFASFLVYLPRHLAAITAILLVWRYVLRDRFRPSPALRAASVDSAATLQSATNLRRQYPGAVAHQQNGRDSAAPAVGSRSVNRMATSTTPAPCPAPAIMPIVGPSAVPLEAAETPPPEVLRHANEPRRPDAGKLATPRILRVNKGRDECLIPIDEIEFVTSSGNYVDIGCAGQVYLLRATLKQMEELLPSPSFVRIHRRHVVNLRAIERVSWRRSGNGVIRLKFGTTVNVSKTYKGRLSGER